MLNPVNPKLKPKFTNLIANLNNNPQEAYRALMKKQEQELQESESKRRNQKRRLKIKEQTMTTMRWIQKHGWRQTLDHVNPSKRLRRN